MGYENGEYVPPQVWKDEVARYGQVADSFIRGYLENMRASAENVSDDIHIDGDDWHGFYHEGITPEKVEVFYSNSIPQKVKITYTPRLEMYISGETVNEFMGLESQHEE